MLWELLDINVRLLETVPVGDLMAWTLNMFAELGWDAIPTEFRQRHSPLSYQSPQSLLRRTMSVAEIAGD